MDIDRMSLKWCEGLDRFIYAATPWLIGFSIVFFTAHMLVAHMKGWL